MVAIKTGMAGSRCGKGRRETTSWLKRVSKKPRRVQGRQAIREQQEEGREPTFPVNTKGVTFRLVITTQVYENYGSHNWNGKGHCPQYWKAKGGSEYQREIGDANAVLALGAKGLQAIRNEIAAKVSRNDDYWEEYAIGWAIVPSNEETYEEQNLREMHEEGYLNAEQYKQALIRLHA